VDTAIVTILEIGTYRPEWLGQILVSDRDTVDTPEELRHRRFPPPPGTPLAPSDAFTSSIGAVPADVAARSSWSSECPVALEDLRYLEMTFWGFDGNAYLGEMMVHADHAHDVVTVFSALYDARFPIEEMRIYSREEIFAPPTGDLNNTSSFECRPVAGVSGTWSQHAYGRAIDINPFQNPYLRGTALEPALSGSYLDRSNRREGMIRRGDVVVTAFAGIGWGWGGNWTALTDLHHFSWNSK